MSPGAQIGLGLILLGLTVGFHGALILGTLQPFRAFAQRLHARASVARQVALILTALLVLIVATLIEVGVWTAGLHLVGAISEPWTGFYFALVTYTTLGYGDVVLTEGYRLTGALCAVAGLLTIGLTTAFLIEVVRQLAERR
jgi:hypothetical protein